jgi:hypothetical protein
MSSLPMNEAAVRGEILAPLLRELGYRANTENDLLYEVSLRHPYDFLGRKKPSDLPVRGKADYICKAGGKVAWVLEAKSSETDITTDAIQQAYTYARHPEIRAVYFCLSTDSDFRVYATDGTPDQAYLFSVDPRDTREAAKLLQSTLGPPVLLQRFAQQVGDTQPPIGPGLLSFAQIMRGSIVHRHWMPPVPYMEGFTVSITGGALQRTEQGLLAYWEGQAPFAGIQRLMERLGLTRVEALSPSSSLSADPQSPTKFEMQMQSVFPQGETLRDLSKHEDVVLTADLHCDLKVSATGVLVGTTFRGSTVMEIEYRSKPDGQPAPQLLAKFCAHGEFEFQLK